MGATQNSLILWPRKAIESIKNVLKQGLQFFRFHNSDNSTDNRPSLGEFVGRIGKEIAGQLHEIVIGYFPNKEEARQCDICSIEADVVGSNITNGAYVVDMVDRITGIALDNSANDVPAFAGAKMLASLQCFEGGNLSEKKIQGTENPTGGNPMTFEELKVAAKAMNVHPSQLYTVEEIKADRTFSAVFDERDSLKKENDELKESIDSTTKKVAEQEKAILRNDAKSRINSFIPKDATKGQKDLIAKRIEKKFDKLEDLTDEGLKSFVDESIEDYNDFGAGGSASDENNEIDENGEKKKPDESVEKSQVDEAFNDLVNGTK